MMLIRPAEPFALQMAGDRAAAADRWRALGCPYEAAAALADSDQEPHLRTALTELERLGARPLAAAVARKLRDWNTPPTTQDNAPSPPS